MHDGLAQLLGLLSRSDGGKDVEGRCIELCKEAVKDNAVDATCTIVTSVAVEVRRRVEDAPEMPVPLLTGLDGSELYK